jgi:gluconokinase
MAGPPAQVVVGLDVGTTGVKAAAFGLGSAWRMVAIREYPLLEPAPGQAVQDPVKILTAAGDALAECVAASGDAEVVAVSVSAGMHGLLALDRELCPLTPLITWADARARDEVRLLRRSGQGAGLHALTGAPVHPMTPLSKLMWFARHDPATWMAARWWVGLKDWILLWLTGRVVTELSSASGTGLLDMSTRGWSAEAIELCAVDAARLPPILPTTATLELTQTTAEKIGLRAGTPVVVGAGDGPLSNLGVGALAPGIAGMSLGTSGAVRMAVSHPQVDAGRTLFCYALTDAVWVVGGAISNGGAVLRWAESSLAPDLQTAGDDPADAPVLELAATAPPGCDGLVMLPYLLAERAPLWDPDLPGAYLGLRRQHTRAHFLRAAVEGVCLQMRLILDSLEEVETVRMVRVTGGAFRSSLCRHTMAAMLGRAIHVVGGDAEGTALGAAALGLFSLGRAPTLMDALTELSGDGQASSETVEPDPHLVVTYNQLRDSIPALIGGLDGVSSLLARVSDRDA